MRLIQTILLVLFYGSISSAQDSCLPQYDRSVKTIKLSSGKMAYVEKGKGKTILFIHGLGGNLSHWLKTVDELSDSYCCIAIDLPGYGRSDKLPETKDDQQLQFYADAIAEFIKKKKISNPILAGHSMGGQVATIAALQDKNIQKLILISPAGLETFTQSEAKILTAATVPSVFEKQDEAVIRNNYKAVFFKQPDGAEQLIQDRLNLKKCSDFKQYCETVSAGVQGMLAHPVKDSLKFLTMPVLILFGADDALIPNRYLHPLLKTELLARESAALIPKCEVEIIDQAGHLLQFEKHKETSLAIKNFIQ